MRVRRKQCDSSSTHIVITIRVGAPGVERAGCTAAFDDRHVAGYLDQVSVGHLRTLGDGTYLLAEATVAVGAPQEIVAKLHAILLREALESIQSAGFELFLEAPVDAAALCWLAKARLREGRVCTSVMEGRSQARSVEVLVPVALQQVNRLQCTGLGLCAEQMTVQQGVSLRLMPYQWMDCGSNNSPF